VAVDAIRPDHAVHRAAEQLTGLPAETRPASVRQRPVRRTCARCSRDRDRRQRADPARRSACRTARRPGDHAARVATARSGGAVPARFAVFSDRLRSKRLEVSGDPRRRLEYFEMLASGIAHEIKNPLVSVKTFAQLLPRRRGDDRFIDDFGRIVTREIGRMERLSIRLRPSPGERPRHVLDLRAPIGEAVEAMGPAFHGRTSVVSRAPGTSPCMILGDHSEARAAVLESVDERARCHTAGRMVRIELVVQGRPCFTVAVVDTGVVIPAEIWNACSTRFLPPRNGLGARLAICFAPRRHANTAPGFGPPTASRRRRLPVDFRSAVTGRLSAVNPVLMSARRRPRALVAALAGIPFLVAQRNSEALKTLGLIDSSDPAGWGCPGPRDVPSPA